MLVVTPFDPWRSPLCTCPPKYVAHPYTGCGHRCLYCYASSYIRDHSNPRPKDYRVPLFLESLERVLGGSTVELSTSSDPYTPPEGSLRLTRRIIEEILSRGYKLLITTKSTLVTRDLDILSKYRDRVVVAVTVTTLDQGLASALEPGAPPPLERLKAVRKLSEAGVPTLVRVDPVIPYLNDDPLGLERLIREAARAGALQVTSSTYKARPRDLARLTEAFPGVAGRLRELYASGERVGRYLYLRRGLRLEYMKAVREIALAHNLMFYTCREGFPELNAGSSSCDGSLLAGRLDLAAER